MRGRAAQQADEVVVLGGGARVRADVADQLRHRTAIRVEAHRGLDEVVLQVARVVARHHHHARLYARVQEELRQQRRVRRRVRAAEHQPVQVALGASRHHARVVVLRDLVRRAAQQVVAARVAVQAQLLRRQLHARALEQARRAADEADQLAVGVHLVDVVEETRDDVVTAGGLAAAEHHTHIDGVGLGDFARNECGKESPTS